MKVLNVFKNYIIEIIVFICGASLMILELAASRLMAPFFGTNIFVWTSIIGIILGCLSLGYHLGGKYADRGATQKGLSNIIFIVAVSVLIISFVNSLVMQTLSFIFYDVRIGSVISTIILFSIPSVFLGMVSPYCAKLRIVQLENAGATVGRLYALSTLGSIVGTFLAGFFLIPNMGSQKIITLVSLVLGIVSILIRGNLLNAKYIILIVFSTAFLFIDNINSKIVNVDTQYGKVLIFDEVNVSSGEKIRYFQQDNSASSAMSVSNPSKLVYEYTKYYDLAKHFNENFNTSLMIGGAAYSYPKYYLQKYPNAKIDVVEIDPGVTELAKKYFNLKEDPRLRIYHEDGRIFINKTNNKYDVIFGDAFKSHSPPFQLSTIEAMYKIRDILNPNGVIIINLISSLDGRNSKFLKSEYLTMKKVFPQVLVIPIETKESFELQNIMLIGLKSTDQINLTSEDKEINSYLQKMVKFDIRDDMPIITDDFAPVEYYSIWER